MNRCVSVILPILLVLQFTTLCHGTGQVPGIEKKVLRVFATKKSGYYHKPWKTPDFSHIRASGFFFKDDTNYPEMRGLILTNAHAVSQAQSIKVSNGREKRRYNVKLVGICNSADFAVVQMESDDLKTYEQRNGKVEPLVLGDSDNLRIGDKVLGWGYPLGGQRISKSEEGEISRIEVQRYAYSKENWLMVQASLQQNRGNSGGPVLKNGKVVGIAFQGIRLSDRINYFIPINLVKNIIPVLNNQNMIPRWRYVIQYMFPRLKDYYGLDSDSGGILVDYIIPEGGPYSFGLRNNDIIVEMDGHEIDNFGDIYFKPLGQKIYFGEILNRKKVGDPLKVKVIRKGKTLELKGKVTPGLPRLVPKIFAPGNYFILGGVGLVELTYNCVTNLGKSGRMFREKYLREYPKRPYEKIVIISEIFPEYGLVSTRPYLKKVEKIDDVEVLNLKHLYDTFQDLKKKGRKKALLQISKNIQLPIDLEGAEALDQKIKAKYGILYMKSPGSFTR